MWTGAELLLPPSPALCRLRSDDEASSTVEDGKHRERGAGEVGEVVSSQSLGVSEWTVVAGLVPDDARLLDAALVVVVVWAEEERRRWWDASARRHSSRVGVVPFPG